VTYLFVPLIILGTLIVLMGLMFFLGRFRGGRYLRPLVTLLSKVGFIRRFFERSSRAMIERRQPELASAFRKLERLGPRPDPQKAAQAIHQLTPAEREAYMSFSEQQGSTPEPANRQQRRLQERMQQGSRPAAPRGGAKPGKKPGKKRR
jgi:hypothetical protein